LSSFYEGTYGDGSGLGVAALLNDRSLEAIPPPLRVALEGNVGVLETAIERLRDVKRLLNSDVASAVGVTISFSDMDGD